MNTNHNTNTPGQGFALASVAALFFWALVAALAGFYVIGGVLAVFGGVALLVMVLG